MSPRSALHAFLAAGALLALSACGAGRVNYVFIDSTYSPVEYAQLPYTGPLYADVSGNPFAIPQEDITRIVNQSIQPSNMRPGGGKGPRIHIAFGATASDRTSACQAPGTKGRIDGRISMVAALCRGGSSALTYLIGSVDDVTGPDDPRFKAFLRQSVVQLFPRRTDESPDNSCAFPSC
jgi:hypothetical protein